MIDRAPSLAALAEMLPPVKDGRPRSGRAAMRKACYLAVDLPVEQQQEAIALIAERTGVSQRDVATELEALKNKDSRMFARVPCSVARRRDLTPLAKLTHGMLSMHQGKNATCWPSVATLEAELGASRVAVFNTLRQLEDKGCIEIAKRGGPPKRTNHYRVIVGTQPGTSQLSRGGCESRPIGDGGVVQKTDHCGIKNIPLTAERGIESGPEKNSSLKRTTQKSVSPRTGTGSRYSCARGESGHQEEEEEAYTHTGEEGAKAAMIREERASRARARAARDRPRGEPQRAGEIVGDVLDDAAAVQKPKGGEHG